MKRPIRFKISYDKLIEIITWIAKMKPGIDIYHLVKVLFYADKKHINRYGRPITGDTYYRLDYGPVPTAASNIIKEDLWLSPKNLSNVKSALIIDKKNNFKLTAAREPDMSYFSKSDQRMLEESLREYGDLSFDELYKTTHSERCYIETMHREIIDYALLVDENNPHKDEILEDLKEFSEYVQV